MRAKLKSSALFRNFYGGFDDETDSIKLSILEDIFINTDSDSCHVKEKNKTIEIGKIFE